MLKGAIVGLGRMGITHLCILNTHPQVRIVAASDPSGFVLGTVARFTAIRPYRDCSEMLDRERPDFVVVAAPTVSHAEIVARAVERDIHTFIEKPFTLPAAEGERILELLERHPVVNQVGYVVRYNPVILKVKGLLDHGALGPLVTFKIEMYGPTVLHDAKSGWRSRRSEGGGCLLDFASHGVDLATYLFGAPREVVGTVFQSVYSSAVEDSVSSTFLYEQGFRGNLLACWSDASQRKPIYRIEAMGRRGKIMADLHAYKAFFSEAPALDGLAAGWNVRHVTELADPVRMYLRGHEFTRQLDAFIAQIVDRTNRSLCTFSDGHGTDMLLGRIADDARRVRA